MRHHTNYEAVIGLEIHAQIATKTKLFCSCSIDFFGAAPNSHVCPICMGFPGMLPVINREAISKALAAARALKCEIADHSKFDRKNYFYPDLPKGFQISQYDKPVSVNGSIDIQVDGARTHVRINRLHVEDDAGKLMHDASGTLCDYNRSGAPLMEIVSEPDMHSWEEASAYAQEIRRILRYTGASECDMEKGMMRFDINVSLRPKGETKLGTKAEVKNLNSFKALEKAVKFEIERQEGLLNAGSPIVQETRGWDDVSGETVSQRSKEEAHDYRYFPEPDLPPLEVTEEQRKAIDKGIPELPSARKERFMRDFGLSEGDAGILTEQKEMADFFEEAARVSGDAKKACAFINTILLQHLNNDHKALADCKINAVELGMLIKMVSEGIISNNMAKGEVFEGMYATGKSAEAIVKEKGLKLVSDSGELEVACQLIIKENEKSVSDYKAGKEQALGFLVGQVMKHSHGQANPAMVNEILRKLLK